MVKNEVMQLDPRRLAFPPACKALHRPNGLLAFGGDLSPHRLLEAYRVGVFPWFSEGEPLMWWTPNPRAVITPKSLTISKSMKRELKKPCYELTWNTAFSKVIGACAAPRATSPGTWIVPSMLTAYEQLHHLGIAHSIEVWQDCELIGGLYGLCLGPFFFGESMFSAQPNGSKIALIQLISMLAPHGLQFLDCQMMTSHLQSLGAQALPRASFVQQLAVELVEAPTPFFSHQQLSSLRMVDESVLNIYLRA